MFWHFGKELLNDWFICLRWKIRFLFPFKKWQFLSQIMLFYLIGTSFDPEMTPRLKIRRQRSKSWLQRPKIGNDRKKTTKNLAPKWRQKDAKAQLFDATLVHFGGLKQDHFCLGYRTWSFGFMLQKQENMTWFGKFYHRSRVFLNLFDCHGAPPKPNVELLFLDHSCQFHGVARGQTRIGRICEGGIPNTYLFNLFQVLFQLWCLWIPLLIHPRVRGS